MCGRTRWGTGRRLSSGLAVDSPDGSSATHGGFDPARPKTNVSQQPRIEGLQFPDRAPIAPRGRYGSRNVKEPPQCWFSSPIAPTGHKGVLSDRSGECHGLTPVAGAPGSRRSPPSHSAHVRAWSRRRGLNSEEEHEISCIFHGDFLEIITKTLKRGQVTVRPWSPRPSFDPSLRRANGISNYD